MASEPAGLTEAEAEVYDRQLRVWGVAAQQRLSQARVVIFGSGCLAAEIAKNLVLAGVGRLDLVDDGSTLPGDAAAAADDPAPRGNFLVAATAEPAPPGTSIAAAAATALREMNPHVAVSVLPCPPVEPAALAATLTGAAAAIVAGAPRTREATTPFALACDAAAADAGAAFFWGGVRGGAGYAFVNGGDAFEWTPAAASGGGEGGTAPTTAATHTTRYAPLERALFHSWAGLHPRRTHGLVYVLRCVADFEVHEHKAPTAADASSLADRGHAIAAADGVAPHAVARFVDDGSLAAFAGAEGEEPAVCAVVGGTLAAEVVKHVTRRGPPLDNLFLYSVADGKGAVERLGEPPVAGG